MQTIALLFALTCEVIGVPSVNLPHGLKFSKEAISPTAKTPSSYSGLAIFESLRGTRLFGNADYDLDKTSDLLFYNQTATNGEVTAVCKRGNDEVGSWYKCGSSTLPINKKPPLFLRPFQLDNDIGYIAVLDADKDTDCNLVSFVPNYRDLAKSPYDYIAAWNGPCNCDFKPLFVDLDFDGQTDLLTMVGDQRVGYLAARGPGMFMKKAWEELTDGFDLDNYSSRDRYPLDVETFEVPDFTITATEDQNKASRRGWWGWLRSWIVEPTEEDTTISTLREHAEDFKQNALSLYSLENGKWMPRPLPLKDASLINPKVSGHAEVDMDGDCVADLVFVVDSPDFQNRQELEIWLTEQDDDGRVRRRLWRSQRLLLPDGLMSVALADLAGTAAADILALAKSPADGEEKLYTFKMLHEPATGNLCGGFHFAFGGLNGRVEREFMTISMIGGHVVEPTLYLRDIDGDRFDDVVLVMKDDSSVFLRVFGSAARPLRTDSVVSKKRQPELGTMETWQSQVHEMWKRVEERLVAFSQSVLSPKAWWEAMEKIWSGSTPDTSNLLRNYEKRYDLALPGAASAYGWVDPSTFIVWNEQPSAVDTITVFPQTGFTGEVGFFTCVKVFGGQCRNEAASTRRSAFPLSGAVVAMAPPGIDGRRMPVRRTYSTMDGSYVIRASSVAIGFADSSNYIDAVQIGAPYARWPLRECGKAGRSGGEEAVALGSLRRTWSAIMPNSALLIEIPGERWKKEEWRLTLIVAPGRQAMRVVVAMVVALVCVGTYNVLLSRKVARSKPHNPFLMIIGHDFVDDADPVYYYLIGDAPLWLKNRAKDEPGAAATPPVLIPEGGDEHKQGVSAFLILMVAVTAVTGFLMGYDLCIVAVVLSPIRNEFAVCSKGESVDGLGDTKPCIMNELFVAILAPGAMVSSLVGGWAADRYGRKAVLILSDVFFLCAATLMSLAPTYGWMLLGRALLGVGIGMGFVVFPTYMAEVAPADVRGILVTCQEVAQCIGCLAAYAVAYLVNPNDHWRILLFCAGVPAILQLLGTLVLPESPRWLVCKRRIRQARTALERISGHKRTSEHDLRYSVVERYLVESPSGFSDSSASRLSRVRATRAVFENADELGIGIHELDDLDDSIRHHASLSRENSRMDYTEEYSLTPNPLSEQRVSLPPAAHQQPPLNVLLNLIEEEELRQYARQKKRLERNRRDDEEMRALVAENRVSRVSFLWYRLRKALSLREVAIVQKVRTNLVPLAIAVGCAVSQNFTGANTILYYSVDLMKMGGVCETVLPGVLIGVVKLLGVILMIMCVERVGRRIPLLVGTSGTLCCHLGLAYLYNHYNFNQDFCSTSPFASTDPNTPPLLARQMTVYLLWGLMFFWNISWAGLMFVVASEVLPSNFRGIGMGITIAFFWVFAFIFQLLFRTLILTITAQGTFFLLAATSALVLVFVTFAVPEMTGKTLEEIPANSN